MNDEEKYLTSLLRGEECRKRWEELLEQAGAVSLFATPDWLAAVDAEYGLLAVADKNGNWLAGLPLGLARHSCVAMPWLTPWVDILWMQMDGKPLTVASRRKEICRVMARHLRANYVKVQLALSPSFTDWQPFMWEGYECTVLYTYRFPAGSDANAIWQAMDADRRNNIARARKAGVQVNAATPVGALPKVAELVRRSFARKDAEMPWTENMLGKLLQTLAPADSCRVYLAELEGRPVAVGVFVHDAAWTYYLIGGQNTADGVRGAMSLLHWQAITDTLAEGRGFDFEGSNIEGIEAYFRGFGAVQTPRLVITRDNTMAQRVSKAVYALLRRLRW